MRAELVSEPSRIHGIIFVREYGSCPVGGTLQVHFARFPFAEVRFDAAEPFFEGTPLLRKN